MASDVWIGRELAGYRIERVVGRGGMGVVYLAEDTRLGRRVALKLLSPELAEDPRFRERFVRESRLAASLEHPNIVPIHAAGESEGVLYLAMRFIEGTDLRALLGEQGRLGIQHTSRIVAQIGAALDAAHAQDLVHRDVKPANVLISDFHGRMHCYLSDFGLTKQASSMTGLTGTGQVVGTVDYLAPEAIEGKPVDGRADQYALGCVLYECLAGHPPFRRVSEAASLWAHIREPPPPLPGGEDDRAGPNAVIRRALAKNPSARFSSCSQLADALRASVPGSEREAMGIGRRVKLAAAGLLTAAILSTALITELFTGTSSPARFRPAPPDSIVTINPNTGATVGHPIHVGRAPTQIVASGNGVWVANSAGQSLSWINATTRKLVRTIPLHATPTSITPGPHGGVWVDEGLAKSIQEITPRPGGAYDASTITIPGCCPGPSTIIATRDTLWVGDAEGIRRIDITNATHPVWRRISTRPAAGAAAAQNGSVYFSDGWDHITALLYGGIAVPAAHPTPGQPSGLVAQYGYVWYTLPSENQVVRLATFGDSRSATNVVVGGEPVGLAATGKEMWAASARSGIVTELTGTVLRAAAGVHVGGRLSAIAASHGLLWVATQSPSASAEAAGLIAYHDTGSNDVDITPADKGSPPRRLLRSFWPGMPDWSPDGRRITFITSPHGFNHPSTTFVASVNGSHRQQLTRPRWFPGEFGPSWSPDGRWIAVWRDIRDRLPHTVPARNELLVLHPDGSDRHAVLSAKPPFLTLAQLDWSPDGRDLVIEQPGSRGQDGPLAIVSATTGRVRRLTLFPVWSARWSPDGSRIAYISSLDEPGIYVTGVDGLNTRKLAAIPDLRYGDPGTVSWSPDGREIAYAGYGEGDGIHLIYADGSGDSHLVGHAEFPAWQPSR